MSTNRCPSTQALYTPAMLASVLGVSVASVRSWQRRGLIRPVKTVNRVPYFDFPQLATGRQLAGLIGQGVSAAALQKKLEKLQRWIPDARLSEMSVTVEGREILLRRQGNLLETDGQRRFNFGDEGAGVKDAAASPNVIPILPFAAGLESSGDVRSTAEEVHRLRQIAERHEDNGEVGKAIEAWRMVLLVGGPQAESCYRLGELLYLTGDLAAARERYYGALELDPSRVELRASLGCVLLELGETELAIAALQGALGWQTDFPDVHYHLAIALETAGRAFEAINHWQRFLELSPLGPWSEQARQNLGRLLT